MFCNVFFFFLVNTKLLNKHSNEALFYFKNVDFGAFISVLAWCRADENQCFYSAEALVFDTLSTRDET